MKKSLTVKSTHEEYPWSCYISIAMKINPLFSPVFVEQHYRSITGGHEKLYIDIAVASVVLVH